LFSCPTKCANNLRNTKQAYENSKKLWACAKEPGMNLDKYNTTSAELAVRDQINLKFAKQLFHFESEKIAILQENDKLPAHMDQAMPQSLIDLEKNEPNRMFNPFLELKGFLSLFSFFHASSLTFFFVRF
jgi:hypothetical protein